MEEFAMLMFCLPMIILEAMLEAHTNAANGYAPLAF
jgi:hypothetical protein